MTDSNEKAPSAAQKKAASQAQKKEQSAKVAPYGYLQNKEGRVFIATRALKLQQKRNKFGLAMITKSAYDEAMENGGLTDAMPDFDEDEG